jgi:hypothetical protein
MLIEVLRYCLAAIMISVTAFSIIWLYLLIIHTNRQ